MKKFLLVLAAAFVLCVPAFADNEVYFAPVPYTFSDGGSTIEATSDGSDVYVFFRQRIGSQSLDLLGISETNVYTLNTWINNSAINNAFGDYYISTGFLGWSSANFYSSWTTNPITDYFDNTVSDADIQAAFAAYLENNAPVPSAQSSFTVPCGNVLYFKVDVEQNVNLSATMPVLSSLLGTPTGAWNSGIEFGPAAALPSSQTTFPILSQEPINFAKSATNQNLLGQTKSALSVKHCIAGQYYALYLPYHYGGWLALGSSHVYPDGSVSGGIVGANVTVSGSFSEIKVYPLSEKANGELLSGSVTLDSGSDDGFASYFDGEISDTGTVTWLNQDGEVSAPTVGGTSYIPEDVSTESIIDQIKNILSSIVSEIKNLFSFGYEAVNTLVGLMRDFVSVFQQLYEWLPSEVYSALISAIIVAITIGVFKVFL